MTAIVDKSNPLRNRTGHFYEYATSQASAITSDFFVIRPELVSEKFSLQISGNKRKLLATYMVWKG